MDPEFEKGSKWLTPLEHPPYAALDASVGQAAYMAFTLGGLDVSIDGEVLGQDGTPIAGLYAAGGCASNIAQDGTGYSSGTCIGESTFFGRRAGFHESEEAEARGRAALRQISRHSPTQAVRCLPPKRSRSTEIARPACQRQLASQSPAAP